jgi:hypothetical protein
MYINNYIIYNLYALLYSVHLCTNFTIYNLYTLLYSMHLCTYTTKSYHIQLISTSVFLHKTYVALYIQPVHTNLYCTSIYMIQTILLPESALTPLHNTFIYNIQITPYTPCTPHHHMYLYTLYKQYNNPTVHPSPHNTPEYCTTYYRTCTNLRILYIFVHTTTISYRTCPHCYLLFILVCTPTISYRTCTHFYILYVYVQKTMCSIYNLYIPTHMTLLCTAYERYSFNNLCQPLYIHVPILQQIPVHTSV